MLALLKAVLQTARSALRSRSELVLENLALRQQLAVLHQKQGRPHLALADRAFWVLLHRCWASWQEVLQLVKPATVVKWHRMGFRLVWRWKSRRRAGRPEVAREVRALIRRMADANPTLGAPRIHGELLKLGVEVAQSTVSPLCQEGARGGCPTELLPRAL